MTARKATLIGGVAAVVLLIACTSNNTTIVVAPSSPASTTMATPGATSPSSDPSPSTHAIDRACATLSVYMNILAKELKGKSPITDAVEGEFALGAKQLDRAVPALRGTEAASDLGALADHARSVGNDNGTNIGDLLDFVSAFGNDAKQFSTDYCN
jgi:hypothetical protein